VPIQKVPDVYNGITLSLRGDVMSAKPENRGLKSAVKQSTNRKAKPVLKTALTGKPFSFTVASAAILLEKLSQ
jgi:hypothetical protein